MRAISNIDESWGVGMRMNRCEWEVEHLRSCDRKHQNQIYKGQLTCGRVKCNSWQGCRGCWGWRPRARGEHHMLELLNNNWLNLSGEIRGSGSLEVETATCWVSTLLWTMLRVTIDHSDEEESLASNVLTACSSCTYQMGNLFCKEGQEVKEVKQGMKIQGNCPHQWSSW